MSVKRYILVAGVLVALQAPLLAADASGPGDFIRLFNGKNLEGFNTYLKGSGLNNDPKKVFRVRDGVIDVSGEEYGYFITKNTYENYHLKAEFKWGEETHSSAEGPAPGFRHFIPCRWAGHDLAEIHRVPDHRGPDRRDHLGGRGLVDHP